MGNWPVFDRWVVRVMLVLIVVMTPLAIGGVVWDVVHGCSKAGC